MGCLVGKKKDEQVLDQETEKVVVFNFSQES